MIKDFTKCMDFNLSFLQISCTLPHLRILAAHEAVLLDLQAGTAYEYRYGLSEKGPWSKVYTFETASLDETVIYVLGDLEPAYELPEDFKRFNEMLEVLREKNDRGRLMLQLGNFVRKASHIESWQDRFEHMISKWNLISAHIAGESESYTRKERVGTFKGFFNLPKNGLNHLQELNYSFDYGDIHVAVIHTAADLDEQLAWLKEDLQTTQALWKVVVGHYSFYGGNRTEAERKKMTDALQESGVHLYIGGNDRMYRRTVMFDHAKTDNDRHGTTFISAGTAGSEFKEVQRFEWDQAVHEEKVPTGIVLQANAAGLTVAAYDINGNEVDSFRMSSRTNGNGIE